VNTTKHPGQFVRETYLEPRKISVTEAAKSIGISRPGVSNFLNGRVSTSADMAARIERAFGISAQKLLDMQAAYDAAGNKAARVPEDVKQYVPPFLAFKANDLVGWVDHNIPARTRVAVFLRTLVNSTGLQLEEVNFPGNDDAERPGWDGVVKAQAGTPWIPAGTSGWEFGVNVDPKQKADDDFAKSVKAHKTKADRDQTTFVFVTLRRWPGKDDWITKMRAKKQWKDVRAYDASDIEQWLEQSPAAQTWLANEIDHPSQGTRSLQQCWSDWASVATPELHASLFDTAIDVGRDKLKGFLSREPGNPLVIAADSTEEALAFLDRIFAEDQFRSDGDKVIVFDRTGSLPKLAKGSQAFIAAVHDRDVERELGPYSKKLRAIIIYPRHATNNDPDITLEPLGYEAFRKGLEAMGCERDEITRLEHESGRSLTVLRRRLAKTIEAVRNPHWATDAKISASLVPLMLVGTWNADNEADRVALSMLADTEYEEVERRTQELSRLNDAPLWMIGNHRGLISKIDALFAVAHAVTKDDLDRYLQLAKWILGEDDPALDLPEKDRWAAATYGKRRDFSGPLRSGISETLVLLSVHGKHLFKSRLNFDGELAAEKLVRDLLTPLTTRTLEASDDDLPVYAEAAPNQFLRIFEDDLKREKPEVFGLLRPIDSSLFGASCIRCGLLWALEGLAWSPATFLRSVLILGRLAEIEIKDNWSNKPIGSLESIFRAWMPQTAANHEQRVMAVNKLMERYPTVGWHVATRQFGPGNDVGHYAHKPKWRQDGYGFGEPFKFRGPVHEFQIAMIEMALSRPKYTPNMLCDLVGRLSGLGPEFQERVWRIIEDWVAGDASDADIAIVREKIRVTVLSRRGRRSADADGFAALTKKAREVYDRLEPKDLLNKHEWLFRQSWVEESADELSDGNFDFRAREERVQTLRREAVRNVFEEQGTEGIFQLASKGQAQRHIGWHAVHDVLPRDQVTPFIIAALEPGANETRAEHNNLIAGALIGLGDDRPVVLEEARTTLAENDLLRLLLLAGYDKIAWATVDRMSAPMQAAYWREVDPQWIFEPDEDHNNESIERLLKAGRPRAAFSAVHFKLEAVRPALLVEMLSGIARDGEDKPGQYQLQEYDLKTAFTLLSRNPEATLEQKAGLEFAYIDVLARLYGGEEENHIPNLERYLADHPEMYVQALVWAYKRDDKGEDPESVRTPEGRTDLAQRGWRLLEAIERLPGQDPDGTIDTAKLRKWVADVRKSAVELSRGEVCDLCLGKMFANSPVGKDGVWPCEPVRDVLEELQSQPLIDGARTARYNQRGVHWRGEGGGQERELAATYRAWADALQFTHPFLSSQLLTGMVKTYEFEAEQQDTEAGIRRRLRH
jgi:addiction module HigA family antidote